MAKKSPKPRSQAKARVVRAKPKSKAKPAKTKRAKTAVKAPVKTPKRAKRRIRGASVLAPNPHIKTAQGGYLDRDKELETQKLAAARVMRQERDALSD
ncbi:MAG: hypothetical protein ABIQ12_12200 [Opitutaceae bacterium]